MSSSVYRSQLERKRAQRLDAEKRSAAARTKEADKRALATRERAAGLGSKSEFTARMKLRDAARHEGEANTAAKESASWQAKAAAYLKEETTLAKRLADAEASQRKTTERKREAEERKRLQQATQAERERERRAAPRR
jgi:hypothetical protein